MIITRQKMFDELVNAVGDGPVFIIGCSECATLCHTGGEEEVLATKKALENKNIKISGWVVLDPACHFLNDKRLLKPHLKKIDAATKVLVLACGNGVQTVSDVLSDRDIIAGCDTLFLGEIRRAHEFEKRCTLCGECLLDVFDGVCPITRCPKSMLNGPCGGSREGKCEVDPDIECVWDRIYHRLKEKKQLHRLKSIQEPKKWSASLSMRRTIDDDL